ncbi:hypothetical protein U724_23895 [Pseudomonas chlororaphis subsp. aurantiaca PB-St2]|nr:hypothetical protein U724_23895 [Pseudomonas chlororaphis subsp. aurantiaca PB-St2]
MQRLHVNSYRGSQAKRFITFKMESVMKVLHRGIAVLKEIISPSIFRTHKADDSYSL